MIETVLFKSRHDKPYSVWTKLNPLWWFGNDEAKPTDTFVYLYVRNNLQNFKRYVVGVEDRDHWIKGKSPATTSLRSDLGETGWQYSVIKVCGLWLLPFVSRTGKRVEWKIGWQPSGRFGFKFILRGTKVQVL